MDIFVQICSFKEYVTVYAEMYMVLHSIHMFKVCINTYNMCIYIYLYQ